MRRVVVALVVAAAAACGKPAQGTGQGSPSGSTGPTAAAPPVLTMEMLRSQACACTSPECAGMASEAMDHEHERVIAVVAEAEACLTEHGFATGDSSLILAKMKAFTAEMCACADRACSEKVQNAMMEWGLKNMPLLERAMKKMTKAQMEEGDRLEEEMKRCQDRLENP